MKRQKNLNQLDILCLVVGAIIGWGSFTLPGIKFLPEAGLLNTLVAFVLGGLSVLFIQAGYHPMMVEQSEDGGEFSYTYRHLGPSHGFICGWGLTLCYLSMVPLNATAFVQIFRILFGTKMNWCYLYSLGGTAIYLSDVLLASFILLLFTWINLKGVKLSSLVQNLLSLSLVAVVFILFLFMLKASDLPRFKLQHLSLDALHFRGVSLVLAIVPFLFVGFDVIPQVASELNFSKRKASLYAVVGIVMGTVVYSLLSTMTAMVYSPDEALKQEWALGEAILSTLGWPGFIALVVALFSAVSAGINGFMLSATHLFSALADYRMIPEGFKEENRYGVKSKALYFIAAVALIAPWFGRPVISYIVDMSSLLAAIAYCYVCYISLRKSEGQKQKALIACGLLSGLSFILLLTLPFSPAFLGREPRLFLFAWILLGFFYYRLYRKKIGAKKKRSEDRLKT